MHPPLFAIEIPTANIPLLAEPPASHTIAVKRVEGADGRVYRLYIATPKAPAPASGYPILYMLDGNGAFAALKPETLASAPQLCVVGVGYDTDKSFEVNARSLDYTPPPVGEDSVVADASRPGREVGGAALFLDRLVGGLRQEAEAGLAIDPQRRALWGHSYGGLFTLFSLFTRPDAFAAYVPVSPSIGFGGGAVLELEKTAPKADAVKPVLLMHGDMESRSGQPKLTEPRPNPATVALVERLRQRADLAVDYRVLEGAQHGPALSRSLPFAFDFVSAHFAG